MTKKRTYLTGRIASHQKTMRLRTEELDAVMAYANARNLTWNGAVRELIRTHPAVKLPPLSIQPTTTKR